VSPEPPTHSQVQPREHPEVEGVGRGAGKGKQVSSACMT